MTKEEFIIMAKLKDEEFKRLAKENTPETIALITGIIGLDQKGELDNLFKD